MVQPILIKNDTLYLNATYPAKNGSSSYSIIGRQALSEGSWKLA